ncbi:MAG: pyridoxal-phosphate dependent enzyme [Patescibacteria group bacterium]
MVQRDEEYIDHLVGTGVWAQRHFDTLRWGPERNVYPNGGIFAWRDLLLPGFPVDAVLSLREGYTDLFEPPDWLKKQVELPQLRIKMDGQFQSESFKDRGMAYAVSEALRLQLYHQSFIRILCCASTGDTSAAAAVYGGYVRDRFATIVFVPHGKVSTAQLFQALAHGALVLSIEHPEGFDACMRFIEWYCEQNPELYLVNSENPFRIVGQETCALEICQDYGWEVPDWIAIPCGNGGNLTSFLVSLLRMRDRAMIPRLPGIIVAQIKGANTLVRWGRSGFQVFDPGEPQPSIASAMNIQRAVSFPRIAQLHKEFRLGFFDVGEDDIQRTRMLFMNGGANICPQSAVALDAVLQARQDGIVREGDRVVAISTASGMKFVDSGLSYHEESARGNKPLVVEGNVQAITEAIAKFEMA